jgi:hypothetical protein
MANSTFAYAASGFLGGVVATGNVRTGLAGAFTAGFATATLRRHASNEPADSAVSAQTGSKFISGANSSTAAIALSSFQSGLTGLASNVYSRAAQEILESCESAYNKIHSVEMPEIFNELRTEFIDRVEATAGVFDLDRNQELRNQINIDKLFVRTLDKGLPGGIRGLSSIEFGCLAYIGDSAFRIDTLSTRLFAFRGRQSYGGDINYYFQGLLHAARGTPASSLEANIIHFNFFQGLRPGKSVGTEFDQVERAMPFARLGYFDYLGRVKW